MRKKYEKLIRDRIPEVMDAEGVAYELDTLDDDAFRRALRAKLVEEATEAAACEGPVELRKELADLLEVVEQMIATEQLDPTEVRRLQERRRAERGGFERRLWLRWTRP